MLGCGPIGRAPGCYPGGCWFESSHPSLYIADVVQLVEHLVANQKVVGSNPTIRSICRCSSIGRTTDL